MTPDAYDILNAALTMWGQQAMAMNDAGSIRKRANGMPIHVATPDAILEIKSVHYDPEYGIVFTTTE